MVHLVNKIKQLKCKHNYITFTNFGGDAIIYVSSFSKKIIRSLQVCTECGKIHKSEYLDKNCRRTNFYTEEEYLNEINRTINRSTEL